MSANSLSIMIPIPELVKRESVRRCLFGRPDPLKLSEELKRQDKVFNEEAVKRFRSKWAFDPETGPLESGPYEFIPVDPLSEIPSFYTKGYPKPVRLSRTSCYGEVRNRPISAKRKLDLDEQDENNGGNNCDNAGSVHKCALLRSVGSKCQKMSSSSLRDISPEAADSTSTCGSGSTISRLRLSSQGLSRSSSEPTLLQLSPMTRLTDIVTPPSKPRVTHQSSITGKTAANYSLIASKLTIL